MFENEDQRVNKQYMRSVITICRMDYPDHWPNMMNDIKNALSSGNEKGVLTGLQALFCLTKKFEFELEEEREPLYDIMQQSLVIIGPIIDQLMNQTGSEIALKSLQLIGKIFYNANQLVLCPFLQENGALMPWMQFFK